MRLIPAADSRCFSGLCLALNNVTDTEGRPLGEGRAHTSIRSAVDMHMRPCPYPGSRSGLPMNRSALQQMTDRWDAVLDALATSSQFVSGLRHQGPSAAQPRPEGDRRLATTEPTTASRWALAYEISAALGSLPAAMIYRKVAPLADGEIPALVAAVFKIAVGVEGLIRHTLVRLPSDPPTAENLLQLAEDQGRLLADGEACAGPERLILQALGQILVGLPPHSTRIEKSPAAPQHHLAGWSEALTAGRIRAHFNILSAALRAYDKTALRRLLHAVVGAFAAGTAPGTPALDSMPLGPRIIEHASITANRPTPDAKRWKALRAMATTESSAVDESPAATAACERRLVIFLHTCRLGLLWPPPVAARLAPLILDTLRPFVELLCTLTDLETSLWRELGHSTGPAPLRLTDREAFGELETLGWMQAILGAHLELTPGSRTVQLGGGDFGLRLDI